MNSLFTSVGRRVELLRAFRRAYTQLELSGRLVATDIDPLAPALQLVDRPYIVPRLDSPDYVETIVNICQREKIGVVFPLIDPDIAVLARHQDIIEATGARLAVVSLEAALIARDKWLTAQFFHRAGLLTPRSWLADQLDPGHAEYPLFVKPRCGSASQYTFKVSDARELLFFLSYVPDPIVQEYLPGPEITNDVICDLDGNVLAVVSRRRIEVRSGEVAKGVTIYDPAIADACVRIAQALPAVGPITVQCMLKDGQPYFTEINARLGGGVPLGIAAGVDVPLWLLARCAGVTVEIPAMGSYKIGLYLTRFDDSFFLGESEYAEMAAHRF